jgi:hypothetical protein
VILDSHFIIARNIKSIAYIVSIFMAHCIEWSSYSLFILLFMLTVISF